MTRRRPFYPAALATLLLVALLGACVDEAPYAGVWRSDPAKPLVWPQYSLTADAEMLVGVYGRDAAGTLRLFVPGKAYAQAFLLPALPCLYLEDGTATDAALTFGLLGPDGREWAARLSLSNDEEVLFGTLELLEGEGAGATVPLRLIWAGDSGLIDEEGLNEECPAGENP
jgi:hypothetical protein